MVHTEDSYMFPYGSQVYGTTTEKSDMDYIFVSNRPDVCFKNKGIDAQHYFHGQFQQAVNEHEIWALECIMHPVFGTDDFDFQLDLTKLRKSISAAASNSWVKAKKKYVLPDEDSYSGFKSLFHSFRIIEFGIQIAEEGKIVDYKAANWIWNEINDWWNHSDRSFLQLMDQLKPTHNNMMIEFRKLAPKAIDPNV